MRRFLILPLLFVSIAACESEPRHQLPPVPDGPNMSGMAQRRMANCPSTVPGAITTITPTGDGIDVTVTARTREAELQIAARARLHELTGAFLPIAHTGMRTGGSRIGFCPIVRRGATLTTSLVPGGVRIHLRADASWQVKELQDAVSARAARLPGFASS